MQKTEFLNRIQALAFPIEPQQYGHPRQLQNLSDIQCIAFDFYGTMFISGVGDIGVDEKQETANTRFFEEALKYSGFSILHPSTAQKGLQLFQQVIDQYIRQQKEKGIAHPEPDIRNVWQKVLHTLSQLNLIEGTIIESKVIQFAIEFEFRTNTIWPVPALDTFLKELLQQGLKLGIISNSQFYTPLAFEALMGESTDDFGFEPELQKWSYAEGCKKPSFFFYRSFTDELQAKNIAPEQVLYVGNDLFKDIIPAKKLNMKTALYVGDHRSLRHENNDLEKPKNSPDVIINDLHQIPACLG